MKYSILFVDDEANILNGYKRNLRKYFTIHTALGGEEALAILAKHKDIAVIVSDMQMPEMNGVEFLSKAKPLAKNSVRMMLTGNADQQTAIDAINQGDIFRFINKPCPVAEMLEIIKVGIKHHLLITAEQELLKTTLKKSIEALIETLSLSCPEAFGSINRIKNNMASCVRLMGVDNTWKYEAMAMLSLIGYISLPKNIIEKISQGLPLDPDQQALYLRHSEIGFKIIDKIPRLEEISKVIKYQNKCFDGSGYPVDDLQGNQIPIGARILKIILDFDLLEKIHKSSTVAITKIEESCEKYDPKVLTYFIKSLENSKNLSKKPTTLAGLAIGMILAEDVLTDNELLLVSKGQEITECVIDRLYNFSRHHKLPEHYIVYIDQQD